jgi:hypothetical protein
MRLVIVRAIVAAVGNSSTRKGTPTWIQAPAGVPGSYCGQRYEPEGTPVGNPDALRSSRWEDNDPKFNNLLGLDKQAKNPILQDKESMNCERR